MKQQYRIIVKKYGSGLFSFFPEVGTVFENVIDWCPLGPKNGFPTEIQARGEIQKHQGDRVVSQRTIHLP